MSDQRWAYYNEHEPVAAEWLRRLIVAGLVAPGEVDERDIRDVRPAELSGFAQCHFFAGIGLWSAGLRAVGVPDDRPWWTGSCPCQPFSAAGRGDGFADERHLWPHWFHLIGQCQPGVVTGEQVADKDGLGWNDLVSADLESAHYAFGSINLCAAGFGLGWKSSAYAEWLERAIYHCPDPMVARHLRNFADWAREALIVGGLHIRQRQFFIGLADQPGGGWRERRDAALARASRHPDRSGGLSGGLPDADGQGGRPGFRGGRSGKLWRDASTSGGGDDGLVDRERKRLEGQRGDEPCGPQSGRHGAREDGPIAPPGDAERLGDDQHLRRDAREPGDAGATESAGSQCGHELDRSGGAHDAREADGLRSPFDWLLCRDGVWRAAEPGTLPLDHAHPGRVGKLRAYGNSIDFETLKEVCDVARELADEAGL